MKARKVKKVLIALDYDPTAQLVEDTNWKVLLWKRN